MDKQIEAFGKCVNLEVLILEAGLESHTEAAKNSLVKKTEPF
jgi:hypothetical protein